MSTYKIAIIHDWLVKPGGGEKVLSAILDVFPEADLFTLVDFLSEKDRKIIKNKKATVSFIQKIPKAKTKYRSYLPLMPLAIEQFDLSSYDVILSSSHAVAKGVITGPDQLHICYCHSPIRYAWDLQHQYLKESQLDKGIKSFLARWMLHKIRLWDYRTANGVNYFIGNSKYIARRIKKVYGREAAVIYPNVDVSSFDCIESTGDYYFTASRMVPYKKMDLIVEAFNEMPDKKLVVIGEGPQYEKIKKIAKSNIELMGYQEFSVLKEKMSNAKAFVFCAEEDFGIIPLEAQAAGTPVIAYGKGGALETVVPVGKENPTGLFFHKQDVASLTAAVNSFEENANCFTARSCRDNAEKFSEIRFKKEIEDFVNAKWDEFKTSVQ